MKINDQLPWVGGTSEVDGTLSDDHWREVFGRLWGNLNLMPVREGNIFGSLHSRSIEELRFNRIEFGNQKFERLKQVNSEEPFYSLTFPQAGSARCQIGGQSTKLLPGNAYLLNNGLAAKLLVEEQYSTYNVLIPISALEYRLGRRTDILSREIIQTDSIYHVLLQMMSELMTNYGKLDDISARFLTNQMLDLVAFFLNVGEGISDDTLSVQATRARVVAYLKSNFQNADLSPGLIAAKCGISRSYLYKLFRDGPSVMEQVRHLRLEAAKAKVELHDKRFSMTEIAMTCGFSSSTEFSRLFKKKFGVAPSKV
jgi:AraC-like DNA-binding protein